MAKRELLGIQAVRTALRARLQQAQGDDDAVHTVVLGERNRRGVVVSMEWRRRGADALGELVDVAQAPIVGVTHLRDRLGNYVGEHVIVTRRTQPWVALVPWDWYVRAAQALGEPVDL